MLRVVAEAKNGGEIPLESVVSLTLSRDSDVPCDSLNLVVEGNFSEEFIRISVFDNKGLIYKGVVDEQISYISGEEKTQIISRSMAALLVDNEAYPETFNFPDTELVFRRYLKPLGFETYSGENKAFGGKFKVSKGMSCFQVAENFARGAYGTSPTVSDNSVVFEEEESEPVAFTQDPNAKGVFFNRMEYSLRRYYPVSHVWVKTDASGGYDTLICDEETVERGILRQRYLNASVPSEVSLSKADDILSSAKQKLLEVTLWCPSCVLDILWKKAQVHSANMGELKGYSVSSLRYTYKNGEEATKVILRRES